MNKALLWTILWLSFSISGSASSEELIKPVSADIVAKIPEAKKFTVAYSFNPATINTETKTIKYTIDNSGKISGKIERIAYYLETTHKDGTINYVFVSMDPFTDDVKKLGIPTPKNKIIFQQKVKNLFVKGKAPNLTNGTYKEGNIEIWAGNYGTWSDKNVPNAKNNHYDFGDSTGSTNPGYGCMQVHNFLKKETVLAFNGFTNPVRDIGIGDYSQNGTGDWTLTRNSQTFKNAKLVILVKLK